jgi:aryl-alcohol dehydrogenase-like predicted oxidoreductase
MPELKHRVLGRSALKVSELCLGTMMFGGPTEEAEARRIIDHAADAGVNFIDTANSYEKGRSEEITGRAIKAKRHHWVLATKLANPMGPGINERGLSRVNILRSVDDSLKRLQLDHIDIVYTHRPPDATTPHEEIAAAFGDVIRAGKIRHWGLSNVRGWHIASLVQACRIAGSPQPVVLQPLYNLMNRQAEVELFPAARHFELGVAPYSPLARGVLSGKYRLNVVPAAGSRAARGDKRILETEWRPESLDLADKLKAHAEGRGSSLVSWAIAWMLNNKIGRAHV